ncbi:hypothetical protein RND81_13G078200 [Saponaria officinalis]|uniref:Uncharacterized protein n=1 Tax=Saponaria officinalis TaxID=3572 RepID=A0AAW1GV22_SAPOF
MLSYYSLQELKNTQTLTNSFHNHHRINHPQRHQHYDNHHGLHHHDHPPHHLRHPPFSLPPPPFPPPPLSRVTPLSPFPPTSSNHQHRRPEGGFADSPLHHHHHRTHHVYDDRSPIHHLTQFHEGFDDFSSAVDRHRFDFVKSRVPPSPVFHRFAVLLKKKIFVLKVWAYGCRSPGPPSPSF